MQWIAEQLAEHVAPYFAVCFKRDPQDEPPSPPPPRCAGAAMRPPAPLGGAPMERPCAAPEATVVLAASRPPSPEEGAPMSASTSAPLPPSTHAAAPWQPAARARAATDGEVRQPDGPRRRRRRAGRPKSVDLPAAAAPRRGGSLSPRCGAETPTTASRSTTPSVSAPASPRMSRELTYDGDEAMGAGPSEAEERFQQRAKQIGKDVPRTFPYEPQADPIRLRIAHVLRDYVSRDDELGYAQGMNFVAAGACLLTGSLREAQAAFGAYMAELRTLWLPGFPMIVEGAPLLQELLRERDPELSEHLTGMCCDFFIVLPTAWWSCLAKWVPLPVFLEILPLLGREGIVGMLSATLMLLLFHRQELLQFQDLPSVLEYLCNLSTQPAPERLAEMCEASLPALRLRAVRP